MTDWRDAPLHVLLRAGNTIVCYDCPTVITDEDEYIIKDGKMFCAECGEVTT